MQLKTFPEQRYKIVKQLLDSPEPEESGKLYSLLKTKNGYASIALYPNSNEDLNFIPRLSPAGKNILTTGSSIDQALTMLAFGARHVDIFDINPLTQDFLALKTTALIYLSFPKATCFLNYSENNKYFLSPAIFNEIKKFLPLFERDLWEMIINHPNRMRLFRIDETKNRIPPYQQNRTTFLHMRERLLDSKIGFYELPLSGLSTIEGNYDIALLSNICDWYKDKNVFARDLLGLSTHLSANSIVQIGYSWTSASESKTEHELHSIYDSSMTHEPIERRAGYALVIKNARDIVMQKAVELSKIYESGEDE